MFRRFNTPFQRLSLVICIAGVVFLGLSVTFGAAESRHNKIFFSENHYGWVPIKSKLSGRVEPYWAIKDNCIWPELDRLEKNDKRSLDQHRKTKPPEPEYHLPKSLSWDDITSKKARAEKAKRTEKRKRYSYWLRKKISLESEIDSIKSAQNRIASLNGVRKSEVGSQLFSFNVIGSSDRTFDDKLYHSLGLNIFDPEKADRLFDRRVEKIFARYELLDVSYHTDLDDWLREHALAVNMGAFLVLFGFAGSFGYRTSKAILNATVIRLYRWIVSGK